MTATHKLSVFLLPLTMALPLCSAFTVDRSMYSAKRQAVPTFESTATTASLFTQQHRNSATELFMSQNGDGTSSSGSSAIELVDTLAKLDKQWKLQQLNKPRSRWTKLVLKPEQDQNNNNSNTSDDFVERPPSEATSTMVPPEDFVYLLEPPNKSQPSCVIVFVGGAGLGQFPHIAYNEFLLRVSNRLNAAVIATPYAVGLDHFGLAKTVGELNRRAVQHCQQDAERLYSSNLPMYCIGHSLGGKLSTIYMAATGKEYDGVGFMSFNNFGFGKTIGMAKEFAEQIQKSTGMGNSGGFGSSFDNAFNGAFGGRSGSDILNQVFAVAESVVGSIGIDFTPTPDETERILSVKYTPERQAKTRMFVFEDDKLDSTDSFVQACKQNNYINKGPAVSYLPGSHLTPVYFKLGLDELPEEAREMASQAMGGFKAAAFGNEAELNSLVDEVSGWMLGKGPSKTYRGTFEEQPKLPVDAAAGGSEDKAVAATN